MGGDESNYPWTGISSCTFGLAQCANQCKQTFCFLPSYETKDWHHLHPRDAMFEEDRPVWEVQSWSIVAMQTISRHIRTCAPCHKSRYHFYRIQYASISCCKTYSTVPLIQLTSTIITQNGSTKGTCNKLHDDRLIRWAMPLHTTFITIIVPGRVPIHGHLQAVLARQRPRRRWWWCC